ncbi:MAG: hypothetical protein MUP41_16730 [Desulfobacterales bacterium]|nr:hypothetical protein [Desulfobacterales bacterium]
MAEKEYIIPYRETIRKRHAHTTTKGRVSRFMVQLEVKVEGVWKEVIRYDCAHAYAHRDTYNLLGKQEKENLHLRFEDALNLADDDIDDNWETYIDRFLRGEFP